GAQPATRAAACWRAVGRARCVHARRTVVRDPRPACRAQDHRLPRHPRSPRSRVPRRPRVRDVVAARPHRRRAQDRDSAAARPGGDVHAGVPGDRLRVALAYRAGAAVTRGELTVRLAPWLYTAVFFIVWEATVRLFNIPAFFLPPPTAIAQAIVEYWTPIYRHSLYTLSTTLIGFGMAVGFGLLLG